MVLKAIDNLEQYNRKHNLEIHGIPESSEENLSDKIIKLGGPRPIIVRFRSYRAKSELYKSKKHLKSVSLNDYFHNAEAVYIKMRT